VAAHGSVTGFPFNAHPGQDARTQLPNSTLKNSGVANVGARAFIKKVAPEYSGRRVE
jgi:hypothetical protein